MTKKKDDLPLRVDTDGIMETRLTRSEAIELMLEQAKELNDARINEIEARVSRLKDITQEELIELAELATKYQSTAEYCGYDGSVSFHGRIPLKQSPKWARDRHDEIKQLQDERTHRWSVTSALNERGKAKLAIMKQVLEGSAEGKAFLDQIEKMSISLNGRMLKAAKEPVTKMLVADTTVTVTTKIKEE